MTKIGSWFETRKRDSGESFVCLKDGAPEWLRDAIHEAHGSDLPNDWIYDACHSAACAIDDGQFDGGDDHDAIHEFADSAVEIYTRELFRWQADMCLTDIYANAESEAEDLCEGVTDQVKRVSAIQYCAYQAIAWTMIEAWKEANAAEEEETSEEEPDSDVTPG